MSLLILLSPAKKQLSSCPSNNFRATRPRLCEQTSVLVNYLKLLSAKKLSSELHISAKLGALNYQRYQTFDVQHYCKDNASPALWTFQGDVYRYLNAATLTEPDVNFAQQYVRLISGLYGLLRPLDLIQLYRLDMGSTLNHPQLANLYQFWGNAITRLINQDSDNNTTLINLASAEYSRSINQEKLKAPMIEIGFRQSRQGQIKNLGLLAKRARGQMARFIIDHKLTNANGIKKFNCDGYQFASSLSNPQHWIFVTQQ